MLTTFNASLSPMLVLFTCIIIGYILAKLKLIPEESATVLSKLEYYVFGPALTFNTLCKNCTVESISKEYSLVIYAAVAIVLSVSLAYLISRFLSKDKYQRNIFNYALTLGNFGYMGQPVILALFGDEMLYKYLIFCLPLYVITYTWGVAILIPSKRASVKFKLLSDILKFPFITLLVGIIFGLLGIRQYFPEFLSTTIGNLGGCMGPVAMVLLGLVVGKYNILKLLCNVKVYITTVLRLFIIPTFLVAVLWLLGANETAMVLCLFGFGTPIGLNTIVYPASVGADTSTGASMATISHALAIISLPLMYSLFKVIFS